MTIPLIALDLGTKTGWATRTESGAVDFTVKNRFDSNLDTHAFMFDRFSSWLSDMIDVHQPHILVLEFPPAARFAAAQVLWGFRAVASVVGYRRELLLDELPTGNRRSADKSDENDAKALRDRWIRDREHLVREAA